MALPLSDHDERQRQIDAGRAIESVDPTQYDKSYMWEVELRDQTTKVHFRLAVVADDYDEAAEIGIWAAATERNLPPDNYLVVGIVRQRRIAY